MVRTVHVDIRGPVIIFNGRKYRPMSRRQTLRPVGTKFEVGQKVRIGKLHIMDYRLILAVASEDGPPEIWIWG